jgi:hypothetical protein
MSSFDTLFNGSASLSGDALAPAGYTARRSFRHNFVTITSQRGLSRPNGYDKAMQFYLVRTIFTNQHLSTPKGRNIIPLSAPSGHQFFRDAALTTYADEHPEASRARSASGVSRIDHECMRAQVSYLEPDSTSCVRRMASATSRRDLRWSMLVLRMRLNASDSLRPWTSIRTPFAFSTSFLVSSAS